MAIQEARHNPGVEPGFFYGYIIAAVALCIMVVGWGTNYAFGVFFKPVLTDFGWTRAMTSGAFSLGMVIQGFIGIAMGGLTDRLGPRIVLTLCGLLLGFGYMLMSQINTIWQLYLFYGVIVGVGMSGIIVPLLSIITRWFAIRRGLMTGIVVAGIGIGVFIGPPLANWLISVYDWRVSYFILGIVVLIVMVLAAQFLRRDPGKIGQLPYGAKEETEQASAKRATGFSFKEAINTGQFWLVFAIFFCCGICLFTVMVHVVAHVTDLGISAASAASVLAAIGAVSIVGKVLMGIVADKIGNRQVFIIGFFLMSASFFWLMTITEVSMFYLFAIVFGFAYGSCFTTMPPLVAGLFGLRAIGLVFGVLSCGLQIGCAIGPFIAGHIFDITGNYQSAFLLCAFIAIIGLILTLIIRPINLMKSWQVI